jgi:PAS domain S-box-containing protein
MTKKYFLARKIKLAFACAILTLLVVGAICYRAVGVSSESDRWVVHTNSVLTNLQDLLAAMLTIESSTRGYVLTGDKSYLVTYSAGVSRTKEEQGIIRNLTSDNPTQQRTLAILDAIVAERIELGDRVIALRSNKGLEATLEAFRTARGKQMMDDFRVGIHDMQQEEERLLVIRVADAKRRLNQSKVALVIGVVLGLLITALAGWSVERDNAARERAENALREGEQSFRTLANSMSQFAWMADEKGYIFWYNDRWFEYTGTTLEQMAGWGWQKVHHPDHVERVVEKITRCFNTGEIWDDTFPLRGKDGNYRMFLSRAVPIRDADGKVLRWFGTNTDISASKESGAKYQNLLEAAPDAMVVVNETGEIVLLNVQAEKQFGYGRDELVGQTVTTIIPEGFAERLIADGTRTAAEALAQQIGTGIELTARRKDGTKFPIEIMLSPLESAEGILVTAAIRDISVRKEAEKNIVRMEGRYRGLLEAAPDAMVVVNQNNLDTAATN